MAFNVILQTNHSEDNRMEKSLTNIATLSGVLRDGTSILDPVIAIEAALTTLVGCNYLTIPDFGRSYFVRNISSLYNGIVELRCHVDVLSTYVSALEDCSGIIRKNETNFNTYLDDGTFHAYANPIIQVKKFSGSFPALDRDFVLIVAGGSSVPLPSTDGDGSTTHESESGTEHGGTGGEF